MPRLRSVTSLALAASVLLAGAAGAGTLRLGQHLRLEGTQLDLRGTTAADADLEPLDDARYGGVTAVLLARTRVTDAGLAFLARLPRLAVLDLYGTAVTGSGFAHLGDLPLRKLDITGTAADDSALAALRVLPLAELSAGATRITGRGLAHLQGLPLVRLDLSHTAVDDDGLARLPALPALTWLDLSYTAVTDRGLPSLEKLPALAELQLAGTAASAAGIERLKAARPALQIHSDPATR